MKFRFNVTDDEIKGLNEKEFDSFLNMQVSRPDMLVGIRLKYSYETKWEYTEQKISYEDGDWIWENDWWEGQEDVIFESIEPIDNKMYLYKDGYLIPFVFVIGGKKDD